MDLRDIGSQAIGFAIRYSSKDHVSYLTIADAPEPYAK
jgi:hypothetical protein